MTHKLGCEDDLSFVGDQVKLGSTVVFPTDTVYGFGSDPHSEKGVARCFELKARDASKPMPVLFSSTSEAEKAVLFDDRARILSRQYWPGKLTIVLAQRLNFPSALSAGQGKLGVRVPNHDCCLKLIRSCGGSLVGTSANVSGDGPQIGPTSEEIAAFAARADYFVLGRCGKDGKPSTVVDLSDPFGVKVVREGAVSKNEIIRLISQGK